MTDALILLGVVLIMGVLVVALLRLAPRYEKEMTNAFEELALRHGLRYQAEDDGRAQEFARHFDGIGESGSPSSGESIPRNVVSGVVDGQRIFLFRQGTRQPQGLAPEWFVAGLERKKPLADRCSVQFCRHAADKETACLADPVVKEQQIGSLNVVIRATDRSSAGRLTEEPILEELAARAEQLPFRPELQVRGTRIVAYPADRATAIEHANDLDRLLGLAKRTVSIAG